MLVPPQQSVRAQTNWSDDQTEKQARLSALLRALPSRTGVYRLVGDENRILYIGKARNLRARVSSYFKPTGLSTKTINLVSKTEDIQYTVVNSETEALLLEQSLIKSEKPPYNVLLRDDKSYPYIYLSDHEYPQIRIHRGSKSQHGTYFGPFPSASAVRNSISLLQRVFRLRPCSDSYFKNRSRPCLQYQIHRCSGPCVGMIDESAYAEDINRATLFLDGKSQTLIDELKQQMHQASTDLEYELAARLRDQIQSLRKVQEDQSIYTSSGSVDLFGVAARESHVCIQGMFIRDGRLLGHRNWFPSNELGLEPNVFLGKFLAQFYLGNVKREIPRTLITHLDFDDREILAAALSAHFGRTIEIVTQVRKKRAKWLELVRENVEHSLSTYIQTRQQEADRFIALQSLLGVSKPLQRIECFDISHSQGEATIASCVVFDHTGPVKSEYRRFKIAGVNRGDDYHALEQAVSRRFTRVQAEGLSLPDILIIDGGIGQINIVYESISAMLDEDMVLLGIAKDPTRKSGKETVWQFGKGKLVIDPTSGAMHLLQQIRDEAHRFAITGHRMARGKARRISQLDSISGVGPKRRRNLLVHFGSVASIRQASAAEIAKVPGVNRKLAEHIYGHFNAV